MSDLILLKDASLCPVCAHQVKRFPSHCRNCGEMLFMGADNFELYEKETALREYWVYHGQDGWKHRTHILDFDGKPVAKCSALSRSVKSEVKPVLSPKEQIQKIRQEVRQKQAWYISQKKKIRSFAK